jgi:predicted transcriptional regulator
MMMSDEMEKEFESNEEEVDTNTEGTNEDNVKDTKIFKLEDGTECSKSAFVREQFTKFNKGRKDIAEEFNIPYRTVYGATVNMENEAEPTSRGRGSSFSKITVTEDGDLVNIKEGITYINGIAVEEGTVVETMDVDRNEWIKEQVEKGVSRADVANALDLSYGVVYGLTKDSSGGRQKYEITLEDGTTISRSEYIRKKVAEGMSKGDIAKELQVEYSVVWQATKKLKTTEEKFFDAIKALEKFYDCVENPELLSTAVESLNNVVVIDADVVKETEIPEDSE